LKKYQKKKKKKILSNGRFYEKLKKATGLDGRFSELSLSSPSPRATQPHRSSLESVAKSGPVAGGRKKGGAKR